MSSAADILSSFQFKVEDVLVEEKTTDHNHLGLKIEKP